MGMGLRRYLLISVFFLVCFASLTNAADKKGSTSKDTRAIMDDLIDSLSEVLPLSFDMKEFSSPKRKTEILKRLGQLRDSVDVLGMHGQQKDKSFGYVANSLKSDAKNVYRWFSRGYYDEAKFTLQNMTENCIACHSSLPESAKFPKNQKFLSKIDIKSLPPLEMAHYQTIARQFDDALSTYETVFRDPNIQTANLIALGAFTRYLKIAIHVKSDFKRPQALLTEIAVRAKTPVHIQRLVLKWKEQLADYEKSNPLADASLNRAKTIIAAGKQEMEFPQDRDGLVHYVTANALLNRYIYGNPGSTKDMAEAYYLLGVSESLLGHSFWISKQDFYLETAIRMAPQSTFAPKAYALLEENLISGYTGSSGTNIPDDVSQLLNELKDMVTKAKKEAS